MMAKQENGGSTLTITTQDDAKKVVEWYAAHMKDEGWKEAASFTASGTEIRTYEKDKIQVSLTVAPSGETGSSVTLIRGEKN